MLIKNSKSSQMFMNHWKNETLKIISDDNLLEKACSIDYPYGGADQMSFMQIINYNKLEKKYTCSINDNSIKLLAYPCEEINMTNSKPLNDKIHIIHFKGGWQPILVRGSRFTKDRPFNTGKEMFLLFLKTYKNAINRLKIINASISINDYNISFPNYLNEDSFKIKKFSFYLFIIISNIKYIPSLILKILSKLKKILLKIL